MKRFLICFLISLFSVSSIYAADKAIVYDETNRKVKVSDPLPVAQGGTGSAVQNFVGLTGDQSVAGIKTFSSIPVLPASDPTTDNQAARKAYADKYANASNLASGTVPTARLGSGTANNTTFLRGDSTWISQGSSQLFTSSGTFTAPTGVTKVYITMIAGGGGGGATATSDSNAGGGGGGEGIIKFPYTVVPGNNYTVTIGGGGVGGDVAEEHGAAGGNTVFDTITVSGGGAGQYGGAAGSGGVANTINASGVTAGSFYSFAGGNGAAGATTIGGGGGGSLFGSGGAGGNDANGSNATGYGSGGGGGGRNTDSFKIGGNGTAGACLVEW
jgi:hypothetical protein